MNACVNAYEMKMPAHYVDMNRNEMEYDGGTDGAYGNLMWAIVGVVGLVNLPIGVAAAATTLIDSAMEVATGHGIGYYMHDSNDGRGHCAYRGH